MGCTKQWKWAKKIAKERDMDRLSNVYARRRVKKCN
jgi:hypothetical protein